MPLNSPHPNLVKLFVAFMTTREAQAVIEKYDQRSSYLVDGTLMAKYVPSDSRKLQDPRELNEVFQTTDTAWENDLPKILLMKVPTFPPPISYSQTLT